MLANLVDTMLADSTRCSQQYLMRSTLTTAREAIKQIEPSFLTNTTTLGSYAPTVVFENYRHNPTHTYGPSGVYITLLVGTKLYDAPAAVMGNTWGFTYPGSRAHTLNDGLTPYHRKGTIAHENMHNIVHLIGADKGLTRAQEENLTRRATSAQLGPCRCMDAPLRTSSRVKQL